MTRPADISNQALGNAFIAMVNAHQAENPDYRPPGLDAETAAANVEQANKRLEDILQARKLT